MRRQRRLIGGGVLGILAAAVGLATHAESTHSVEWRYWGADKAFTRYLPLDQITAANVGQLRVAWRQPGSDPALKERYPDLRISGNFRSTPLMINGVLYAPNAVG
jgi:glucose dehydrogenase